MPVLSKKLFLADKIKKYVLCVSNIIYFRTISPKKKGCLRLFSKNRYRSASLTAEAALVFPVFFFGIYVLWQLFVLLLFQMEVCHALTTAAMQNAYLGYTQRRAEEEKNVDISWLYQPILWNALPESERVEDLWVLCLPEENGSIQVKAGYRFSCEAVFFSKLVLPVRQSFRFYPYAGITDPDKFTAEETEQKEDVVYVTEYGTVYHESRACGYLTVVVRPAAMSELGQLRNSSGRKYTLCERCEKNPATETIYISDGGTKYHRTAGCSALKRTIMEKTREEAAGLKACHKCAKKQDQEE